MAQQYRRVTVWDEFYKIMASTFDINPGPQGGQGAYGAVPGAIGLPNPQQDLAGAYPNLSGQTGQASSDVMSELRGELSPETQDAIQRASASFGVSSGMPLSGLSHNKQLESLGLSTEALQQQGIGDFLKTTKGVADTQTVTPELQAQIASRNALFGSAPNPAMAAQTAQQAFLSALAAARGNPAGLPTGARATGGAGGATAAAGLPYAGAGNPAALPQLGDNYHNAPATGGYGPFGPSPSTPNYGAIPTGNAYGGGPESDIWNPNSDIWNNAGENTGSAFGTADPYGVMSGLGEGASSMGGGVGSYFNDLGEPAGVGAGGQDMQNLGDESGYGDWGDLGD